MKQMKFLIKIVIFILLVGCKKSSSDYDYLMQHPDVLQKEYKNCENRVNQSTYCVTVIEASQDFLQLVEERNKDPIAFGSKIIQIQMKLAALASHPESEAEYKAEKRQLKILYAVVAATSRE